ncbi:hypothetical protein BDZ97DRAFT_1764553 [Flammula alnicola]|nr:hypothetical protein BDZ97DRAFT_1764553 [Flammula alnicola]
MPPYLRDMLMCLLQWKAPPLPWRTSGQCCTGFPVNPTVSVAGVSLSTLVPLLSLRAHTLPFCSQATKEKLFPPISEEYDAAVFDLPELQPAAGPTEEPAIPAMVKHLALICQLQLKLSAEEGPAKKKKKKKKKHAELYKSSRYSVDSDTWYTVTSWHGRAPLLQDRKQIDATYRSGAIKEILEAFFYLICYDKKLQPAILLDQENVCISHHAVQEPMLTRFHIDNIQAVTAFSQTEIVQRITYAGPLSCIDLALTHFQQPHIFFDPDYLSRNHSQRRIFTKPHANAKNDIGVCALVIYLIPDGEKPTPEKSRPLGGEGDEGRGSLVYFNQATMYHGPETSYDTLQEARKAGLTGVQVWMHKKMFQRWLLVRNSGSARAAAAMQVKAEKRTPVRV